MVKITDKSRAKLRTSMGDMTLAFLTDKAPRTVENFVKLAHKGFYDGLTFHRVLKDFMVQGGCPKGDGSGGPGYTIRPEFNDTPHVKGTVSMARSNDPHSAGSQFFIMHGDARYLDSRYTAFAKLVDGEDVLDKIADVPTNMEMRFNEQSVPRDPVYINGVDLEKVEFDEDEGAQGRSEGKSGGKSDDGKGGKDAPESKDAKGGKDSKDAGKQGGGKDAKDSKGAKDSKDSKDDDGGKSKGSGGRGKSRKDDDDSDDDSGDDGDDKPKARRSGSGRKKAARRGGSGGKGGGRGKSSSKDKAENDED